MRQLMHSFHGLSAPAEVLAALRRGEITAFCLFRYNVESPAQVRELTRTLREAALEGGNLPPIIGIDQEGGQLIAICEGATELPGNMALGATRSTELAERAGEVLGRELLAMGVNLNFAPAVDITTNPNNVSSGTRCFGDDPELVSELSAAIVRGMQHVGCIATAKHFPGHGPSAVDSHYDVPVSNVSLDTMRETDLKPFYAAMHAGVGAVMVGHMLITALDEENITTVSPATFQLLRGEMGYDGLTMTDAMDMQAVARLGYQESVEAALHAGNDLILLAHLPHQLELAEVLRPLERPDAVARIESVQWGIPQVQPPLDIVGCPEHWQIAQEIADRSITLVRDNGQLPLQLDFDATIAVITPYPENLTPADTSSEVVVGLAAAIEQRHGNVTALHIHRDAPESEIREIIEAALTADVVIVGTISASHDPAQIAVVTALQEAGKSPIVAALRTPFDLAHFPAVETYLCAYSIRAVAMEAVARVLFGEIAATGELPCRMPDIYQA